jgi:hypothetical protein
MRQDLFHTNDGCWKLWIVIWFGRITRDPTLLKEIERIAKFPTRDELEEGANEEAIAILNGEYN